MLLTNWRFGGGFGHVGDWWGRRGPYLGGAPAEDDIVLSVEQPSTPTYNPPYGGVFREEVTVRGRVYQRIRTVGVHYPPIAAVAFDDSLMAAIVPPNLSIVQSSPRVVASGMIPPDQLPN